MLFGNQLYPLTETHGGIGDQKATFIGRRHRAVSRRSQFWHQAVILASAHPLVGWGLTASVLCSQHLQRDVLAI